MHLNDILHFVSVSKFITAQTHKLTSCMKIKGTIIIHVKFKSAQKLTVLKCFIILYVQILSAFENWDI